MNEQVQEISSTDALQEIATVEQRTRTIPVTQRIVAKDADGNFVEKEVKANVFVRPLPLKRWAIAIHHITGMLEHFPDGGLNFADTTALGLFAASLIGEAHEDVFAIMKLATDKDDEFFDQIDLDEGLKVILAVIEVNKDFFVQKVLPLITETAPTIQSTLTETFGQTLSPSFSETDTDG